MNATRSHTRSPFLWAGLTLLGLGVVFAAFGIWGAVSEHSAHRDLDSMVAELRAKGAIVENYYQATGKDGRGAPSAHWLRNGVIAGILVVGGAAMIFVSRKADLSRNCDADPH